MKSITFVVLTFWAAACAKQSYFVPPTIVSFEAAAALPKFDTKLHQHTAALGKKYPKRTVQIGYIYTHAAHALAVQHEYGVPAELTLAVSIFETGFGQSSIATRAANFFNIKKGDGWDGAVYIDGRGVKWRQYRDMQHSFDDFGRFILKRVPHLLANPTPEAFAATGYAGQQGKKQYAAALHSIIQAYELVELFK